MERGMEPKVRNYKRPRLVGKNVNNMDMEMNRICPAGEGCILQVQEVLNVPVLGG